METYCVREKKKTKCVPGSDEIIKAKGNGRLMLRCICASCGITKHSFIKTNKKGGLLDLHAAIGKLPKQKVGSLFQVTSTLGHIILWINNLIRTTTFTRPRTLQSNRCYCNET